MKPQLRCVKCRCVFDNPTEDKPPGEAQVQCQGCDLWQTPVDVVPPFNGVTPLSSTIAGKYDRGSGI